jgi:hypothetical protein
MNSIDDELAKTYAIRLHAPLSFSSHISVAFPSRTFAAFELKGLS